ncbi:cyclin-dependent kinase inhibitor 1B-like [Spea bombifrons]|uniref:cyclin-dependent kinase inhibitor 1B-like n=1 Tax=Spea bombifrons TaxID=233779 RepID=UPI00234BEF8D|nr:cyclin-dependent kinase inhibitor 1B-like [Spea bombifrons]
MATFNIILQDDPMPVLPRGSLGGSGKGACRSLFGPIDHDELKSELKRQLKEIQASDCQRWNFDFEAGTPLKGVFSWEPLDSKDMPNFYRESRLYPSSSAQVPRQTQQPLWDNRIPVPTETKEENLAEAVGTLENTKFAKENAEKSSRRCQAVKVPSKTSTQLRKREISTAITDYFPKRKRTLVQRFDSLKGNHPFCTLEQTPRKKIR